MRIAAGSILNTVPETTIRHSRRIKRDRAVGPAWPQHGGDIGGAEQDDDAKHHERHQQRSVSGASLAPGVASSSPRTILCEGCQISASWPANRRDYATPDRTRGVPANSRRLPFVKDWLALRSRVCNTCPPVLR